MTQIPKAATQPEFILRLQNNLTINLVRNGVKRTNNTNGTALESGDLLLPRDKEPTASNLGTSTGYVDVSVEETSSPRIGLGLNIPAKQTDPMKVNIDLSIFETIRRMPPNPLPRIEATSKDGIIFTIGIEG